MKIQKYIVAGHIFELCMDDCNPMWGSLANYLPFSTSCDTVPLFSLQVAESLPEESLELLFSGDCEEADMPRLAIFRSVSGYRVDMSPTQSSPVCGSLALSADFSSGKLRILNPANRFAVDNALMLMYAFCTAGLLTLEMHASVVVRGGSARMFLGASGAGKSTHSRMWLENLPGSVLLNDDNPVVRILPDGSVRVYGTPWSGKTPCYKNEDAPLAAFVRIVKAPFNRISRQSLVDAYSSVYSSCSGFRADRDMADGIHSTIEALVTAVPGFVLECLPDAEAANVCCDRTGF